MHAHRVFNGVPHCRGKKLRPIMSVMGTVADYSILITIIKPWTRGSLEEVHLNDAFHPPSVAYEQHDPFVPPAHTSILLCYRTIGPRHEHVRLCPLHFEPNSGTIFIRSRQDAWFVAGWRHRRFIIAVAQGASGTF